MAFSLPCSLSHEDRDNAGTSISETTLILREQEEEKDEVFFHAAGRGESAHFVDKLNMCLCFKVGRFYLFSEGKIVRRIARGCGIKSLGLRKKLDSAEVLIRARHIHTIRIQDPIEHFEGQ